MAVRRMDHVGIVVEDLPAATAFFVELGLVPVGEGQVEGAWVGRVIGLEAVRSDIAMLETPDGRARIELSKFHSPVGSGGDVQPANRRGLRHVAFLVEDLDEVLARLQGRGATLIGTIERYEDVYRLCYLRGPEGIIVELAEELG